MGEDSYVVGGVATNPAAPAPALAEMDTSTSVWVRRAVAQHLNAPPETLQRLIRDPDLSVQ